LKSLGKILVNTGSKAIFNPFTLLKDDKDDDKSDDRKELT
jgi:hypothetical protein